MPSLVLFGRRWGVGSDDFVVSSGIDIIFKGIWFFASGIILWKNYEIFGCGTTKYILIGFLAMLQLSIILDALLLRSSRTGSIMEPEKRAAVPILLYLRILSELFLISWNILTSFWYSANHVDCTEDEESLKFIFGLITFNWILLGIQFIFLFYTFDFKGTSKTLHLPFDGDALDGSESILEMTLPKTKYSQLWRKRLNFCCCHYCDCTSGPGRDEVRTAFGEVARLFASLFGNEDLVHSDVMAGLILLSKKHRREKLMRRSTKREWLEFKAGGQILREPTASKGMDGGAQWSFSDDSDWRSFKHLSHFLKYASAVFGWMIVMVQKENPCQALIKNLNPSNCLPCRKYPVDVEGDNCCYLETTGMKATIEAEFQDIIFASFKNALFQVPFFISLDHATKSVVIGIRGTLSFNDFLLDMVGWPAPIPGYPTTFKTHRGMLIACLKIKENMESRSMLPNVFSAHPNYSLIITGHSLGSGCSVILSLLLLPEYPNLKCYAYSPPGGLLSQEAAEFCDKFVTSVTYGDDFVTRLGILQFERLKYNLIQVLSEAQVPKYKILTRGFLCWKMRNDTNWLRSVQDQNKNVETNGNVLFQDKVVIPITSEGSHAVSNEKTSQACPGTKYPNMEPMFPPGKIIHIRRRARKSCGGDMMDNGPEWIWRWADRTDFDEIIVSKRMFFDHIPIIIPKSLKYLEKIY